MKVIKYDASGVETDESLRARVIESYGMWGAFCTAVLESSGKALDECAKHEHIERARK